MNSRNQRVVQNNKLASQLLYRLLDWRKWDELKLAEVTGILPSVISAHLSGKRPIRPQHLAGYLRILDRHERSALLDAWLQDNVDYDAIANLLDGTRTDTMRSVEENRGRMLDWWAMAIARDFKLAKIFQRFRTKATFKFSFEALSLANAVAVQFQAWLLEKAVNVFTRVKHVAVALVTFVLALCQPDKVTRPVSELVEHGSELTENAVANSLMATSFVTPALADTTSFNFDWNDLSSAEETPKTEVASRAIVKSDARLRPSQQKAAPADRIQRTINHEWQKLVTVPKNVHSAVTRVIGDAHRQFKQAYRKQRRS